MSFEDTNVTATPDTSPAPVAPVADAKPAETPKTDAAPAKADAPAKTEDELLADIYREANATDKTETTTEATKDADGKPIRNERGQFVSSKPAEDVQPDSEEKPAEAKPADAKTEKPDALTEGHFRGWSKEKREAFGKLPKEAQEFAIAHQRDLVSVQSKREAEFQRFSKAVQPLTQTVDKYADYLDQVSHALNAPAHEIIGGLMETEKKLRFGTFEQKVSTLLGMAKDYGIPLQLPDEQQAQDIGLDPRAHDLNQENARLKAQLDQIERHTQSQRAEQESAQFGALINNMVSATDENGQPLYPNFELHRLRMGKILASGEAESLEDAYRIADEPMRRAVEAEAKARAEKLMQATRAGRVNVTTAPTQVNRYENEEDLLRSVYRNANA